MSDERWSVREQHKPTRELAEHLGNEFLLGNGFFGLRGTLDEYDASDKVACIATGLYDQQPGKWREPVNLPNPLFVRLSVNGQALHALTTRSEAHSHGLDFRRAVSFRETVFLPDSLAGETLTLRGERFVSLEHKNLLCSKLTLTASSAVDVEALTGVDGQIWDLNGPHLQPYRVVSSGALSALFTRTLEQGIPVVSAALLVSDATALPRTTTEQQALQRRRHRLEPGKPVTFWLFGHVGYGPGEPTDLAVLEARLKELAARGYDSLLAAHEAAWHKLWQRSDVVIEGDESAQHALRYSIYQLLAIAPYHTRETSIPARGLSGQVYKGAVFWDTELFMQPFFQHTQPAVARTLLEYRIAGLKGAREKAREYGHEGAFYAWESQEEGRDACTHFNVNNVFTGRPIRTFFRDKQIHISGDIALAFAEYFRATGDLSLLVAGGAEVLYECARFLLSWSYYQPQKQRYELLDVTGPDEYHERVNNDFYTNVLSKFALETALWAHETMQKNHADAHGAILERTKFADILPAVRDLAAKLYVAAPDAQTGLIPQFDRYFQLEDCTLEALSARKQHPNEYLGGGEGIAVWTQIIKQADVVLTLSTFADRFSTEIKRANFRYYEPRTEHGSSLSACSYAIVAAEIGELAFAYEYFMKTATIDITGKSKQYVGDLFIGGTHPAANGGAWLAVVRGFCGILNTAEGVSIAPRLPAHWQRVSVPYRVLGNAYQVDVEHGRVSVRVLEQVGPHPRFFVADETLTLAS